MMTRFFDNTITTKFIKYLISHFNIPTVQFWEPNKFVKKGTLCIYKANLYRINKSGHFESFDDMYNKQDREAEDNPKLIHPFVFGEEYKNLTTRCISNSISYDPTTHYYLGEYLRAIKSYFDIDLMPMYNCFSGLYIDDVDFGEPDKAATQEEVNLKTLNIQNKKKSETHKIFSVPIKFGKSYTIAIDSDLPVEIIPVIYGDKGLNEEQTVKLLTSAKKDGEITAKYLKFNSSNFQKMNIIIPPIEWVDEGETTGEQIQSISQYERYLKLLVKTPRSNKSSFVVLEGTYNNILKRDVAGTYSALTCKDDAGDEMNTGNACGLISTPRLTFFNDGSTYAFSDTLIQYLLLGVISNMDPIDKNILRIQEYISSTEFKQKNGGAVYHKIYSNGVWDDDMKDFIFRTVMESKYLTTKLDKNGYVDRETESIILRGQTV